MGRAKLPIPEGLIGQTSQPVPLLRRCRPFVPFTSYVQLAIVVGTLIILIGALVVVWGELRPNNGMYGALIGGVIGASVGATPSLIRGLPYGVKLHTAQLTPWVEFTRSYLGLSGFNKSEDEMLPNGETWITKASWWKAWPNQDVVMVIGENDLYVTGPKSMIMPLSRNWKRMEALGSASLSK